jgi:predicted RNase H-like nuclease (RuvC/YqgF family)
MSMLDDYKRMVEKPMVQKYEKTIAAQREEIERLRAANEHLKEDRARLRAELEKLRDVAQAALNA